MGEEVQKKIEDISWWRMQLRFLFKGGGAFHNDLVHQQQMIKFILMLSIPTLIAFSLLHWKLGFTSLATLQFTVALVLAASFIAIDNIDRLPLIENITMMAAIIIILGLFLNGGIERTGIHWTPLVPFFAFSIKGLRKGWYWVGGFVALVATSSYVWFGHMTPIIYSPSELLIFVVTFIFFGIIAAIFELMRERRQNDLMLSNRKLEETQLDLQYIQDNLEKTVAERTSELKESNTKLNAEIFKFEEKEKELKNSEERFYQAQKMEAVGTLVGGIAHDFNNILSGINANLFMVKVDEKSLSDKAQKRLDDVETLVINGADMIRQLMTFARKDRVELKTFDLSEFVTKAARLAEVAVPSRIKFRCDIAEDQILICGNRTQLQQIIMNLVNNARDALHNIEKPVIHIRLNVFASDVDFLNRNPKLQDKSYAQITIADNGSGIDSEQIEKIFEPFFTTKEVGKGTGLGLSMCYGAIQSHGGIIKVNSSTGKGTAFHIYLPISHSMENYHITDNYHEAVHGKGETILLVDDDNLLRSAHRDVLEALDYNVLEADNGRHAIKIFKAHKDDIDLVIMDIMMPVMGGAEAADQIRTMRNDIKIIYATGYDKDSSLGSQVPLDQNILDKPFTVHQLSISIRKELDV